MKTLNMKRVLGGLAAAAAMLCLAGSGTAVPEVSGNLGDLIQGQTPLYIGDKVFADWDFSSAFMDADDVIVRIKQTGAADYVLQFEGPFFATPQDPDFDAGLWYSVQASGGNKITAIDQAFNLTGGNGSIGIGETVYANGFNPFTAGNYIAAQSTVNWEIGTPDTDPPGEVLQGDQLVISPGLTKVWVTKDVGIQLNDNQYERSLVGATIIYQSFHQTSVPDGGVTVTLLGLALMGIAGLRRILA